MGFQKMCGCVWEKNRLICYQSDAKCIRAGENINAGRTVQHKPLSTTEGQRVALMNVGSFIEIRGDSINFGHRWSKQRKLSTWIGTSKNNCPCDLMMGCASADITDGTARIRHSLRPMIPFKDEIEGKKTSMLAQMYDRKRILVMLQIMWPNISY